MTEHFTGNTLDQKTAEQLARLFNVAFNGALLYGGDHPTTKKSTEPFVAILRNVLQRTGTLSFVLDRESFFLEEMCLDKIINTKRIRAQFTKAGIVSVTFDMNVTLEGIQTFIRLTGDNREGLTFEYVKNGMQSCGCKGIKLNYVHYGKITDDQAVVGKEFQNMPENPFRQEQLQGEVSRTTLNELQNVISLSTLFEQPQQTTALLKNGIENPDTASSTLNALTRLRKEIAASNPPSIDLLLNAVYELKSDLSEAIEAQKATGRLLSIEDPATVQVDQMTVDVIVKLVKAEYGSGNLSLKRLSQIILRMLPSVNELHRVLPDLKTALLAQGMSLSDYCQLVNLLDADLESEMLSGSLTEAAKGIGVSVKEIANAIKAQPSEAARLIYLAAEIRQGAHTDDTHLSDLLTDYIEKVTTDLALEQKEVQGPQGNQVLRSILHQLEEQLINKLKKYGVERNVMHNVQQQLSSRFEGLVTQASDLWLENIIPENGSAADETISKITSFLGKTFETDQTHDTLVNALRKKGYDQDRINTFFKNLTEQVNTDQSIHLPPNVLSPKNMLFLLNREIKQQARYQIHLSTLMITIHKIKKEPFIGEPRPEQVELLRVQVFRIIKRIIREIDLLGTLGPPFSNAIFIIMSMTSREEASAVAQRLESVLSTRKFVLGNDAVFIQPAISITNPIADTTTEYRSYLELVGKNHKSVCDQLSPET